MFRFLCFAVVWAAAAAVTSASNLPSGSSGELLVSLGAGSDSDCVRIVAQELFNLATSGKDSGSRQ